MPPVFFVTMALRLVDTPAIAFLEAAGRVAERELAEQSEARSDLAAAVIGVSRLALAGRTQCVENVSHDVCRMLLIYGLRGVSAHGKRRVSRIQAVEGAPAQACLDEVIALSMATTKQITPGSSPPGTNIPTPPRKTSSEWSAMPAFGFHTASPE